MRRLEKSSWAAAVLPSHQRPFHRRVLGDTQSAASDSERSLSQESNVKSLRVSLSSDDEIIGIGVPISASKALASRRSNLCSIRHLRKCLLALKDFKITLLVTPQVQKGKFCRVEANMPNMKEIASMANVSLGTVSHVLNGSARVREPLRKRVLEAVAALGYQPSELARGLRRDKTNVIGMIIPDITNPFFPAVVRGAEDVAFANGYRLILCNTDNDHAKELAHLNALRTYLPTGLIVIPSTFSDLTVQAEYYRKAGAAVVCVDRLPRHWNGDSVTVANEEGAYKATSL